MIKVFTILCAMLGALSVTAQAGVAIDQYGNLYHTTPGGVVTGVNPMTGMPVTGHVPPAAPAYPESDPSMFGQVRPDGSIIGIDGR
jgi:hypothetical protein